MIKSFFSTLGFLTIIPIPEKYSQEFKHSVIFFPVVGLLIGIILIGINLIFSKCIPKITTDFFLLITITVITGAIHIDGFSDTIDGLYGGKNKEEIIKIMDDPHIGVMGIVGIFFLLSAKFFLIFNLPQKYIFQSLIFFPIISRSAMAFSISISKPLKNGLGKMFIENSQFTDCLLAGIFSGIISFLLFKIIGVSTFVFVLIITFLLSRFFEKKIGGVSGDNLGFINETSEILSFLSIVILI